MDGVTLITPTGDRHVAFMLCERYMRRQSYTGPLQWIVVDDGVHPTQCTYQQDYIRRVPGDAQSLNQNLLAAIPLIRHTTVLIIEDDDWYAETYVVDVLGQLEDCDVVGSLETIYYDVRQRRYVQTHNANRSCLCRTGFRSQLVAAFRKACVRPGHHIDSRFWRKTTHARQRLVDGVRNCVGIKGMPGRRGIGVGHRIRRGIDDIHGQMLLELLGEDAYVYLSLFNPTN